MNFEYSSILNLSPIVVLYESNIILCDVGYICSRRKKTMSNNRLWMIRAPLMLKKHKCSKEKSEWCPTIELEILLNDAISSSAGNILMRLTITFSISNMFVINITMEFTLLTFIYRQRKRDCQDKMLTKKKAKRVSPKLTSNIYNALSIKDTK